MPGRFDRLVALLTTWVLYSAIELRLSQTPASDLILRSFCLHHTEMLWVLEEGVVDKAEPATYQARQRIKLGSLSSKTPLS
jgi:hypothetical protein